MNDITEVDRLNAEIADLKKTIEWYQGRTGIMMGAAAQAEIAGHVPQPAPTGANFTDHSTAPESEKVRRVLQHLVDGDSAYFYNDGYPRYKDLENDARACLKVWAAITTGPISAPTTTGEGV